MSEEAPTAAPAEPEAFPEVWPPDVTDDALREFVLGYLAGRYFTDRNVRSDRDVLLVFIPLLFGAFSEIPKEKLLNIGTIYASTDKVMPRMVNGYPMFMECQLLNKAQAERAWTAIERERERLGKIEV